MFLEERAVSPADQSGTSARYIRLNPEMNVVPELDDTDSLGELQHATSKAISEATILDLALHLVASTFYFKKQSCSTHDAREGYDCHGKKKKNSRHHKERFPNIR